MDAITTSSLRKTYGNTVAVENLDLSVREGEIFGFLGPNGAGKSTTINVLLDFVKPTTGTASILGLDVSDDRKALHNRIGVVPENYGLYDRLSGRRHVKLAVELKGADDDPNELLDRVGLSTDDASRPAGEYSTGMSQRLALAMALVGSPELLLLDEPTSGLDPNGARELRELIREENERGATVFFSSHILEQVEAVSDRVGIMNDGQVVAVDTIDQLRRQLDTGAQVTLHVDHDPEQELNELPNVRDVTIADGVVQGTCLEPSAKLQFIDQVREVTTVTDIQIEESSMEELFASYTDETTSNSHRRSVVSKGIAQ
ncbi:ABC transporter ATP-binding protein [Halorubrum halophilum]|uniref:ABC transporter ATP-binding protein n=1 Tax=Halorubrum halophilum TaxID=413816 RepID=UPI00186B09E2|nr:ABC transporter ATP-binding protein [Halorubrum halophilum]